jgi:NAD(P)-dependent dehydrogenase (short-subunit alcohol dehydrogenase family)
VVQEFLRSIHTSLPRAQFDSTGYQNVPNVLRREEVLVCLHVVKRVSSFHREQQALILQADITDPDHVTAMFARIKAAWKKLDFFILNAGGASNKVKRLTMRCDPTLPHR